MSGSISAFLLRAVTALPFLSLIGCAVESAPVPITIHDRVKYSHAEGMKLVEGVTTRDQVRETMTVAPSNRLDGDHVWYYFWRLQPQWTSFTTHEDGTALSDRIEYTDYLFLEFDEAGTLRRHLKTTDRRGKNPFDNEIINALSPDLRKGLDWSEDPPRDWPRGGRVF